MQADAAHDEGGRRLRPGQATVLYALLILIGLTMATPFVWMVLASFKPNKEVEDVNPIPKQWKFENYPIVLGLQKTGAHPNEMTLSDGTRIEGYDHVFLKDKNLPPRQGRIIEEDLQQVRIHTAQGMETISRDKIEAVELGGGNYLPISFPKWYFNSFFIAAWVTFLQVLTSSLAGYAFARVSWPGRDRIFLMYLGTMMIPGVVLMIPNFQIISTLGLYNSYLGLIIPGAFTAFGTFLLRQFMLSIPKSLDEAAEVDGASHWQIYWEIVMPLSRPGLITLAIFTFMGSFQSFFWPLVLIKDEWLYTLPIGMLHFDSTQGRATELIMAASVMNIVPMIVLFVILQKFLVKGIQMGGVKG